MFVILLVSLFDSSETEKETEGRTRYQKEKDFDEETHRDATCYGQITAALVVSKRLMISSCVIIFRIAPASVPVGLSRSLSTISQVASHNLEEKLNETCLYGMNS